LLPANNCQIFHFFIKKLLLLLLFPDILEEALTEHDAEGSFYDIIRFLLSSILTTHHEEEEGEWAGFYPACHPRA
jgi:hypothetical protein